MPKITKDVLRTRLAFSYYAIAMLTSEVGDLKAASKQILQSISNCGFAWLLYKLWLFENVLTSEDIMAAILKKQKFVQKLRKTAIENRL